jgi:antitoxin component YwqK of YwqJK toxin-antitoxin module
MAEPSEPTPQITRYPNGKVKFTGSYLDGDMHGYWEWFRTDGSIMRTGAFDRGKQIGVWRTFDRSGQLVKEASLTKGS